MGIGTLRRHYKSVGTESFAASPEPADVPKEELLPVEANVSAGEGSPSAPDDKSSESKLDDESKGEEPQKSLLGDEPQGGASNPGQSNQRHGRRNR